MPHVSRRKLSKAAEQQLRHTFEAVLTHINKPADMKAFLSSLLSETEQLMFAKRLAIVFLLNEGFSESEISRTLNVTRETVNRLQLTATIRNTGYAIGMKAGEKEKHMQEFKKILISLARYSAKAAGGRL